MERKASLVLFFTWIVVVSLIILTIVAIVVMVVIVLSGVNSDGELSYYTNQFYKIDNGTPTINFFLYRITCRVILLYLHGIVTL